MAKVRLCTSSKFRGKLQTISNADAVCFGAYASKFLLSLTYRIGNLHDEILHQRAHATFMLADTMLQRYSRSTGDNLSIWPKKLPTLKATSNFAGCVSVPHRRLTTWSAGLAKQGRAEWPNLKSKINLKCLTACGKPLIIRSIENEHKTCLCSNP